MRNMALVEGDLASGEDTASLEYPLSDFLTQVLVTAGTMNIFPVFVWTASMMAT